MPTGIDPELSNGILDAATRGAAAVQAELKRHLSAPLTLADQKLEAERPESRK
jgi:hypothetical protein